MARILCKLTIVLVVLFVLACTPAQAQDKWAEAHHLALAKNPPGVTLTLSPISDKRQWRQGELIELKAVFAIADTKRYNLPIVIDGTGRSYARDVFVVDPANGTTDPLKEGMEIDGGAYVGTGGEPSDTLKLTLNEWLRFDKPGNYRLYLTTERVYETLETLPSGDKKYSDLLPVTSNVLDLEILPKDPVWAAEQVREAVRVLTDSTPNSIEGVRAAKVLRYLGTREAATAMLRRLAIGGHVDRELRRGLLGFPDRAWLIGEMRHLMDEPDFPISSDFLNILTDLDFSRKHRPRVFKPMRAGTKPTAAEVKQWEAESKRLLLLRRDLFMQHFRRAADTLPRKTGKARIGTLTFLLFTLWNELRFDMRPPEAALQAKLTRQLIAGFDDLSVGAQIYLLDRWWPNIRDFATPDALLPALHRIVESPAPQPPPPSGSERYWTRLRQIGIALRAIYRIAPAEGRRLLIEEIKRPRHRTTFDFLALLPDDTLPALDEALAANIENPTQKDEDGVTSWLLVERYATPAIEERVKKVMGERHEIWPCVGNGAPLAYLLRVDTPAGAQAVEKALNTPGRYGCANYLLGHLAEYERTPQILTYSDNKERRHVRHMTPELEQVAVTALNHEELEIASDAARVLGRYGSATVEAALRERLRRPGGSPEETARPIPAERTVVEALTQAQSWILSPAEFEELKKLCRSPLSRGQIENDFKMMQGKIRLDYSEGILYGDRPSWSVAQYRGSSLNTLKEKLTQFPAGTTFEWIRADQGGGSKPKHDSPVLTELRAFVQARGMTITVKEKQPRE